MGFILEEKMINPIDLKTFTTEFRELVFAVERKIPSSQPIIVSGIMTALSASMQDLIQVRMPNGVVNPVSLAIGVIAESGERKTSVLNLLLEPLHEADKLAEQEYDKQIEEYKSEIAIHNLKVKAIKGEITKSFKKGNDDFRKFEDQFKQLISQEPSQPERQVRCHNNTTIPALMKNMSKSSVGQLFVSTEAGGTINKWSMDEIGSLIGLLDGENIKVERASTESYAIQNKRLSCAFSMQPQLYDEIISRKGNILMDSGLIPRMLISKPMPLQGYRAQPQTELSPFIGEFYKRIEELLQQTKRKKQDQPLIEMGFSPEAAGKWTELSQYLETSIAPNGHNRDVSKWVNRNLDNVSRMAALIEYYMYGSEDRVNQFISLPSLNMAIELGRFWLNETRMLFGDASAVNKQQYLGEKLLEFYVRRCIKFNQPLSAIVLSHKTIYTNGPRELRNSAISQSVIAFLFQDGWLENVYWPNPEPEKYPYTPLKIAGYRCTLKSAHQFGVNY